MIDTARIFPFYVIVAILVGLFHFVAIPQHPLLLLVVIPYALIINKLRSDGKYIAFGVPLLILDLVYLMFFGFVFMAIPILILLLLNILLIGLVRREVLYFSRTILSLNDTDRAKARKAMKTGDATDIAEVANYTDWNQVS